jgi:hypothetical protein
VGRPVAADPAVEVTVGTAVGDAEGAVMTVDGAGVDVPETVPDVRPGASVEGESLAGEVVTAGTVGGVVLVGTGVATV